MPDIYQEHLLEAPDVCRNCLAVRLVEQPHAQPGGLSTETTSKYTRCKQTTELDHHPSDPPTNDRHLFCECGVPNARDRIWTAIGYARFRELLKQTSRTLEHKHIDHRRKTLFEVALQDFQRDTVLPIVDAERADAILASAAESALAVAPQSQRVRAD